MNHEIADKKEQSLMHLSEVCGYMAEVSGLNDPGLLQAFNAVTDPHWAAMQALDVEDVDAKLTASAQMRDAARAFCADRGLGNTTMAGMAGLTGNPFGQAAGASH